MLVDLARRKNAAKAMKPSRPYNRNIWRHCASRDFPRVPFFVLRFNSENFSSFYSESTRIRKTFYGSLDYCSLFLSAETKEEVKTAPNGSQNVRIRRSFFPLPGLNF